jgi:hypothetical protein
MAVKKRSYEIECISWKDAVADTGWKSNEEVASEEKTATVHSIGIVAHEDDKEVVLANTWGVWEDGEGLQTNSRMAIPKGWIVGRKRLKVSV